MQYKHLIVVGEGLFSEKEFPSVADTLKSTAAPYSFHTYFMKGQLRVSTLTPEEQALLGKFSELTGMEITDIGAFDPLVADHLAEQIAEELAALEIPEDPNAGNGRWICAVCGYGHTGDTLPETCPQCGRPASEFRKI